MSNGLVYISVVFFLIIFLIVFILRKMHVYSERLYQFLLSPSWKSIGECVREGYDREITLTLLESYYKLNLLEVRLHQHVFSCKNCKVLLAMHVLHGLQENTDIKLPIDLSIENIEATLFQIFEDHMFQANTVKFLEFKTVQRRGRKRNHFRHSTMHKHKLASV